MKIAQETGNVATRGQIKNFRARQVTLDHLRKAQKRNELPSESATIKVALAFLEAKGTAHSSWKMLQDIQRAEAKEKDAQS